jgi:hypothetical protein
LTSALDGGEWSASRPGCCNFLHTNFTLEILYQAKELWGLLLEQSQLLSLAQFTEVCLYHLVLHLFVLLVRFLKGEGNIRLQFFFELMYDRAVSDQ